MAIKFVCDVCCKEFQSEEKGPGGAVYYPGYAGEKPMRWAIISVTAPSRPVQPKPEPCTKWVTMPLVEPYRYIPPRITIVCSPTCAEKSLEEAKEYVRKAFE